jgi:hypothetical protein
MNRLVCAAKPFPEKSFIVSFLFDPFLFKYQIEFWEQFLRLEHSSPNLFPYYTN